MEGYIKPIGGEFYFQYNIFNREIENFCDYKNDMNFLSGGQSSMSSIFHMLNFEKNGYILLPSYLCPTMLIKLKESGINYAFYKINRDLSIDIDSIDEVINKVDVKAILFIDYFGFYHDISTREYIASLKKSGRKIIEDAVQMLWFKRQDNFIGDFVFNSYRKFLPIDGSILICNDKISLEDINYKYYETINKARAIKALCIDFRIGDEQDYLNLFNEAENYYYEKLVSRKMDDVSKELLNSVDINYVSKRRVDNFRYLEENLKLVKEIRPLFYSAQIESIPLGYAVFAESRDELRTFLRSNGIYCPVHWNLKNEEWIESYMDSLYISQRLLTIPIDQRYNFEDMKKVVFLIEKFYCIKKEK